MNDYKINPINYSMFNANLYKQIMCTHPEHSAPRYPPVVKGQPYRHVCPSCKKVTMIS